MGVSSPVRGFMNKRLQGFLMMTSSSPLDGSIRFLLFPRTTQPCIETGAALHSGPTTWDNIYPEA